MSAQAKVFIDTIELKPVSWNREQFWKDLGILTSAEPTKAEAIIRARVYYEALLEFEGRLDSAAIAPFIAELTDSLTREAMTRGFAARG